MNTLSHSQAEPFDDTSDDLTSSVSDVVHDASKAPSLAKIFSDRPRPQFGGSLDVFYSMDFAKDLDSTGLPDTYSAYYFAEDLVAIGWSREDARTFLQAFTSASFIGYLVYRIVNERLSYEQVQSRGWDTPECIEELFGKPLDIYDTSLKRLYRGGMTDDDRQFIEARLGQKGKELHEAIGEHMGELESRAQIQIIRILVEEGYTEQDFVWKEHIREWRLSEAAAGSEELIRLLARYRLPVWSLSSLCNGSTLIDVPEYLGVRFGLINRILALVPNFCPSGLLFGSKTMTYLRALCAALENAPEEELEEWSYDKLATKRAVPL